MFVNLLVLFLATSTYAGSLEIKWTNRIPGMSALHPLAQAWVGTTLDKHEIEGPVQPSTLPLGNLWNPNLGPEEFLRYKRMAIWSAASYCSADKLMDWSCGPRCEGLTSNTKVISTFTSANTDTVGFVGAWTDPVTNVQDIVVAFRGSVSARNWIENLKFAKEPTPWPLNGDNDCKVHTGFLDSYLDVQEIVRTAVSELLETNPKAKIVVTGHSLGGALSEICAADLKSYLAPDANIELVTFHAPRVGNVNFSNAMHELFPDRPSPASRRFTNRSDPLCHLPPYFLGYLHTTGEVWVTLENRTMVCNPDDAEDPNCSNSVWPDDVSNHFYIWNVFFGPDCSI